MIAQSGVIVVEHAATIARRRAALFNDNGLEYTTPCDKRQSPPMQDARPYPYAMQ